MATSPGIMPETETTDQPNGGLDLLESRTTASFSGATIHCTDNAERSCSSPATGGTQIELQAKLLNYFLGSNKSNINQSYTITVVTFLHKRVFQTNALARTWYKPRGMSALEHMAQGRVLWLEVKNTIQCEYQHSQCASSHGEAA